MKESRVAVVSYEDSEFQDTVGVFLADHFFIEPVYMEILTRSSLARKNLEIYLVNSDALDLRKEFVHGFRAAVGAKNAEFGKSIFMLTKSLKAREYLRNQELMAADTIDIGSGFGALKVALSNRLLERQLFLYGINPNRQTMIR